MATLADLESQVAAAVLALPGGTKTRLSSDYSESIPVAIGEIGVQVRATLLSRLNVDSAIEAEVARVEVMMIHRLAIAESEQVYAAGQMVADMSALILGSFWESLAAVLEFPEDGDPGVSQQPELRGSIFIYSVISDVVLAA